jgi:hypothetical protein
MTLRDVGMIENRIKSMLAKRDNCMATLVFMVPLLFLNSSLAVIAVDICNIIY